MKSSGKHQFMENVILDSACISNEKVQNKFEQLIDTFKRVKFEAPICLPKFNDE